MQFPCQRKPTVKKSAAVMRRDQRISRASAIIPFRDNGLSGLRVMPAAPDIGLLFHGGNWSGEGGDRKTDEATLRAFVVVAATDAPGQLLHAMHGGERVMQGTHDEA